MVFCSGVKGCIGSVMGCEVARALQVKVVNYFKSCNWSEVHAWCFLSGAYGMLFCKGAPEFTGSFGSYLKIFVISHLIICFFFPHK